MKLKTKLCLKKLKQKFAFIPKSLKFSFTFFLFFLNEKKYLYNERNV